MHNNLKWVTAVNSDSVRVCFFFFNQTYKRNQPCDLTTQMLKGTSYGFCLVLASTRWVLGDCWAGEEVGSCGSALLHDCSAWAYFCHSTTCQTAIRMCGCQHSVLSTSISVLFKSVWTHLLLWFLLWSAVPSWLRAFKEKPTLSILLLLAGVNPNSKFMTRYAQRFKVECEVSCRYTSSRLLQFPF